MTRNRPPEAYTTVDDTNPALPQNKVSLSLSLSIYIYIYMYMYIYIYTHTLNSHGLGPLTLSIKIAQKPYIIGSSGPKAVKYESFEGKGKVMVRIFFIINSRSNNPNPQISSPAPGIPEAFPEAEQLRTKLLNTGVDLGFALEP